MADRGFTDEDVQRAVREAVPALLDGPIPSDLVDEDGRVWGPDDIADLVIRKAFGALAAAGRLLPPDAETRTETKGPFGRSACGPTSPTTSARGWWWSREH